MIHFQDSLHEGPVGLLLRAALLIYHSGAGEVLVTSHDVHYPEGGVPQLLHGYPLTREQADELARGILQAAPVRTVLPENVLTADGIRLAWWTPAQRRRIWFSREQQQLQHVSRREVLHPPLLWVVEANRPHLFALAENRRPDGDTPIYQAPYLNIYADGWVCAERFPWPGTAAPGSIPEWEKTFFNSEGAKCWCAELTRFPGGHNRLWEAMLTAEEFPSASLVPTGMTVLDAIQQKRRRSYPEAAPVEVIVPQKELVG